MKTKNFLRQGLKNESGIALLMVIGVIAILTFLLADFTFETKLNKIKVYNQQDKIQARLNAEAGLNFAMAKLRMYQEGRNKIEKDENMKTAFPSAQLEAIIIQPFMYPVPTPKKVNIIQKNALEEFNKKTIFRGEVSVTFSKISGLLNPNGLRLKAQETKMPGDGAEEQDPPAEEQDQESEGGGSNTSKKNEKPDIIIEKKMVETITRLLKEKSDSDEEFHSKYSNIEPAYLVKELKFYVNDSAKFQDSRRPEIESKFSQKNITPKHAPLASIDELYLLPSWDDAIVDLIKERMSVHEVSVIAINELTIEDLKVIFPDINEIQIEEFFKYRDGDEDKKIKGTKFKSAEDFKNVIVNQLNIVSDTVYQERISQLKQAGLSIDTSGKLYKINSRGVMNNAVYNLISYVDLPVKEEPVKPKKPGETPPPGAPGAESEEAEEGKTGTKKEEEKAKPVELLVPRVIETRLE
jgi:hypothetical protein